MRNRFITFLCCSAFMERIWDNINLFSSYLLPGLNIFFGPTEKHLFQGHFPLLNTFCKKEEKSRRQYCGPLRIKLPPGSCYRPLANSSYMRGILSPSCVLFFLGFLLRFRPSTNTWIPHIAKMLHFLNFPGSCFRPLANSSYMRGDTVTLFCPPEENIVSS